MDNKLIGNENNIIFYNDEAGQTKIEVILQNENVWLNIDRVLHCIDMYYYSKDLKKKMKNN